MTAQIPEDVDALYEKFRSKEKELESCLREAEAEQQAGRTGYSSVIQANHLSSELRAIGNSLVSAIERVRSAI